MLTNYLTSTALSVPHQEAKELWRGWKHSSSTLPLFPIPDLQGDQNFDEWRRTVDANLCAVFLEGFIKGTETPPQGDDSRIARLNRERFEQRRQCAFRIIYDSINRILPQLKSSGHWTLDVTDRDPKVLWDAVHRWDADRPGIYVSRLLDEFYSMCHCQHKSDLNAYRDRAFWLRMRFERMGIPIPAKFYMFYLVKGLETYDLDWANRLYVDIGDGKITCTKLDIEIGSKYAMDKREEEHRENLAKNELLRELRQLAVQILRQLKDDRRLENLTKNELRELVYQIMSDLMDHGLLSAIDHQSGQNRVCKRCSTHH